mgnify:CR=1 FL=1
MKKIKIAFTGVFDIDNFGDHLFPIIFENSLRTVSYTHLRAHET